MTRSLGGRRIGAALVAIVAFALFLLLGFGVTHLGEPGGLLAWERTLVGRGALLGWWLTWAAYPQLLIPLGLVLIGVAWRVPAWRGRIVFSLVVLLLCWRAADLFQHLFARPRRLDWVVHHERSFSYPSSHAAIATGFYALWAGMLLLSDLPRALRWLGCGLLVALALAICWARLALGAHYATDLIGGALLALALVSAGVAVTLGRGLWDGSV